MGQENEIKDSQTFLNDLASHEEKLKKENIFSDDSFEKAKKIALSYLSYEQVIKNNAEEEKEKKPANKNLKIIEDNKENKLGEINKEFEILKEWIKLVITPYKSDQKSNEIVDKEQKVGNNKESINFDNYTDKALEEKLRTFYKNNKSEFKKKLFKGPPDCFRTLSWLVICQIPSDRNIDIYHNYLAKDLNEKTKAHVKNDLDRTFSNLKMNEIDREKLQIKLYNVLKAFLTLDEKFGYSQGMNFIAGFLLNIFEENEVDAFYMFVSLFSDTFIKREDFDYNFRGLCCEGVPLSIFLNFIFDILLQAKVPEVDSYLKKLEFINRLWIETYIETIFTLCLPLNMCKRVWDCVFADNIYFLVKFGIAFTISIKTDILEKNEEKLQKFFTNIKLNSMMPDGSIVGKRLDVEEIIDIASKIEINPSQYLNIYKFYESFQQFVEDMRKNTDIKYHLEKGNVELNEMKLKNRKTFNEEIMKELYEEDLEKIKDEIKNENNYVKKDEKEEPKVEKDEIIINENQINNEKEKDINKNEIKNEIKDEKK